MAADGRPVPLCAAQEGQWEYMCALSPDDPGASRVVVVDNRYVECRLDRSALERAYAAVVRRHDGLRLCFDRVAPDPAVRLLGDVEPPVEFLDLGGLGGRRQAERLEEIVFAANRPRFDLRGGPLWRSWVVRLAAERFFVGTSFSHVVADGWASQVFTDELVAWYAAELGEASPPDDAVPSLAELRALQARRLEPRPERLCYWRERLLPLPPASAAAQPRDEGADLLMRHAIDFRLVAETVRQVKRVAWRARTTPFVVLLAAYHLLLSATTGRERTVVATATLGRPSEAERRAVFQCVSDPYVSTTLTGGRTLHDAVVATHEAMESGARNLVAYTALARAVNPAFDAMRPWADVNLCDGNLYSGAFAEPVVTRAGVRMRPAPIDLVERAGRVPEFVLGGLEGRARRAWLAGGGPSIEIGEPRDHGRVLYNLARHGREEMQEFVRQYLWAVKTICSTPEARVGDVLERHGRRFRDVVPAMPLTRVPAATRQNDSSDGA